MAQAAGCERVIECDAAETGRVLQEALDAKQIDHYRQQMRKRKCENAGDHDGPGGHS